MLLNTIVVVALGIITVILLHLVVTRVMHLNTISYYVRETFSNALQMPLRPFCTPHDPSPSYCNVTQTIGENSVCSHQLSDVTTRATVTESSPLPSMTTTAHKPTIDQHPLASTQSLEDELKQWMQRESSNWAENAQPHDTNATTSANKGGTEHRDVSDVSMGTSLDKVFQSQTVNMDNVTLPVTKDLSLSPTSNPKMEVNTNTKTSVAYTNTMNSGNLGNGLSAFDQTDCAYATFE